jgi:hypothetical protein
MAVKAALESKTIQEDIVCDHDGIYEDRYESSDQFAINPTPDPYSDIKDMVTDYWPVNDKQALGLNSLDGEPGSHSAKDLIVASRRTLK